MADDIDLLAIQLRALFRLTGTGRIEGENDPDGSPGPRFWLAGCASGNVFAVRADVDDVIAGEIAAIAATEPPFVEPGRLPWYLGRYLELLSRETSPPSRSLGLTYDLPHDLPHDGGATLVDGDSPDGRRLHAVLSAQGMPDGLAELGFRSVSDLWPPWCAAMVGGELAAIAFAARLSADGAELGVTTARAFRGRGHAAAVAAGWSRLPALRSRTLFYSTDQANGSSQRVVARLGLRFIGSSLRLS